MDFFAGALRTCINEMKNVLLELAPSDFMDRPLVDMLNRRLDNIHATYQANIGMIPRDERLEFEHDYRTVRTKVLDGMVQRLKAILDRDRETREAANLEGAQSLQLQADIASAEPNANDDQLDLYASDNEQPMPITRMSLVSRPADYQPIEFSDENHNRERENPFRRDRRVVISENRRTEQSNGNAGVGWSSGPEPPPPAHEIPWGDQVDDPMPPRDENRRPRRSQANRLVGQVAQAGPSSPSTRHGRQPYVWKKQTPARGPVHGVPYPPMGITRPLYVELKRDDPAIVGMSEIWTQRKGDRDPKKCAHCQFMAVHRMYDCTALTRASVQRRWYHALKLGVCLNCLMIGHSSFTCTTMGCCSYHGTRHSSFLCEESYNNHL